MATFEIIAEDEADRAWRYDVQVIGQETGQLTRHTMRLSWADYNHWSPAGADEPRQVAEAVLGVLLSDECHPIETLPGQFDASLVRRVRTDADECVSAAIGR